ncbi:AAA domain-containing protein [Scheffersomyces amazonensis]|uniref:AAA domain-containing protein n=1 Tax=Scheffersomyces amazonensis TaxID=1078765 RepID=UPI00315C7C62
MSSLYKLSIKGIRSFEPEHEETIQFGFPLTLIWGQNGCGKTTIIECLKYATTGDLPPNSKGGAFVNDPSLSGRSVVSGQIKLAFRNANGKSMITTRTVQLTRKHTRGITTNTFKTLEGQLATIDGGNKISISTKNAELDTQTPIYLAASKAILDYVIFCHQDEMLWPLSEASVLKKRFDEIFEASKFTKVLDSLKTIKKDMTTDIKLIEQSVKHLKLDKDRAKKVHDRLQQMNDSVDQFSEEISNLNIQIEQKEKEAEELFASNQQFQKTLSDYETLKIKQVTLQESIERMKNSIEVLNDPYEDLINKQTNFNKITKEKQDDVVRLQKIQSNLNNKLESKTNTYNQLIRLEGSLKSKESDYNGNLMKIEELINDNAEDYNFEGVGDVKKDLIEFSSIVENSFEDAKKGLEDYTDEFKQNDQLKQKYLQEVLDSITREEQHLKYNNKELNSIKDKLSLLNLKIDASDADEDELISKRSELQIITESLDEKKKSTEGKDLDVKISSSKANLSKLEFELEEISKNISASNEQADLRSRLSFITDTINSKLKIQKKLTTKHGDLFKELVGVDLNVNDGKDKFFEVFNKVQSELRDQDDKTKQLEKEIGNLKAKRDAINQSLSSQNVSINSLKEKITKVLEVDEIESYDSILSELEKSYSDVIEDVNTAEVTKQFNITAIQVATDHKHCLLCKRSFEEQGLSKFIQELQNSVNQEKINKIQEDAADIKKELEDIRSVNSSVLSYRSTVKSAGDLKGELVNVEESIKNVELKLSEENKKNKELQSKLEPLNDFKTVIQDIERSIKEISDLKTQASQLENQLGDFGTDVLSITELQRLQSEKNSDIKKLRIVINDDTDRRNEISRTLQRLESQLKDIQLNISNLERNLAEVTNLKKAVEESKAQLEKLRIQEESITKILKELDENKIERKKVVDEFRKQGEIVMREKESILKDRSDLRVTFTSLSTAIKEFESNDLAKLRENAKEIQVIVEERDKLSLEIEENSKTIRLLEKEVSEASRIELNIVANIDYRAQLTQLENTHNQINVLDLNNAQAQKEEYHEKSRKIRQELNELTSSHAGKIGEVKQIKDQAKALQKELQTEYKNVNENYHEEWVKLQTNMLISNDIQTYSKVLDNAIMKYHSIKMEDINRILNELWSQTYKGTDISSIAIKSDVNLQAKGNRSYNYRVVMYKDTNELDMRGRCSAGQKVLASILIRLALAECFGVNCGMIALDEPTTNLDSENAISLAEALNHIIEYRKAQSNFQLIIITHDENFLTHINGGRFTDHFYRIQRDENQSSRIYSLPISKMQEN